MKPRPYDTLAGRGSLYFGNDARLSGCYLFLNGSDKTASGAGVFGVLQQLLQRDAALALADLFALAPNDFFKMSGVSAICLQFLGVILGKGSRLNQSACWGIETRLDKSG